MTVSRPVIQTIRGTTAAMAEWARRLEPDGDFETVAMREIRQRLRGLSYWLEQLEIAGEIRMPQEPGGIGIATDQPITIELHDCRCTCWACPSQFECRTRDGRHAYLRFRSGHGSVGIADDPDTAVDAGSNVFAFQADDFALSLEGFAALMPPWITIETPAIVECVGWDEERIAQALPENHIAGRPDIAAIQQRAEAATLGPWKWRGNVDVHTMRLSSRNPRNAEYTVMDFERWGMQDAVPRFNINALMHRAHEFAVFEVFPAAESRDLPRVYRGDIIGLRHPDAEFMAHARQDIDDLLAYIEFLEAGG